MPDLTEDLDDLDFVGTRGVMVVMVAKEKVGDFSGVRGVGGGCASLGRRREIRGPVDLSKGVDADRRLAVDDEVIESRRSGAA